MAELNFPEATEEQIKEGKGIGILSYIWWLCIVPLVSNKDNPFITYHARQGLFLAILQTILMIISGVLSSIAWGRYGYGGFHVCLGIFSWIFWLAVVASGILSILGIVNVSQGKFWKIPVLGDWAASLFKSKA